MSKDTINIKYEEMDGENFTNEQIAKAVGRHCFKPNNEDHDFMLQLFFEKVLLGPDDEGYSEADIEERAFLFMKVYEQLHSMNLEFDMQGLDFDEKGNITLG